MWNAIPKFYFLLLEALDFLVVLEELDVEVLLYLFFWPLWLISSVPLSAIENCDESEIETMVLEFWDVVSVGIFPDLTGGCAIDVIAARTAKDDIMSFFIH